MLNGKVALVTGAAGNLGHGIVQTLSKMHARIIAVDKDSSALHNRYQNLLGIHSQAADLTDAASVRTLLQQAAGVWNRLDIVVNVAGGFRMGPLVHETSDAEWDGMLDLNTRTVFHVCREALPYLLEQGGGKIINIAARAALQVKPQMAAYCVSKSAVITLTQALAEEYKHRGININCILPSIIDTPQNRAAMPGADFRQWVSVQALADVVLFLASDAARAIHGAAIPTYGVN